MINEPNFKNHRKYFVVYFILITIFLAVISKLILSYTSRENNIILFIACASISFFITKLIINKTIQLEQLRLYASTDSLTGVYNRRTAMELLHSHYVTSRRYGRFFSICFADINDLKRVNDNMGHDLGDIMIKALADIFKNVLRESDIISRLGGDEFLIIFPNSDLEQAKKGWKRVQEKIRSFNDEKIYPFSLSVSAGFSEFNPRIPKTADMLVNEADHNMYENKNLMKETGEDII